MTKPRLLLHTLAFTCLSACLLGADDFKSLFNGKNLRGWNGNSELWKVEDGTIVGSSHGHQLEANTFLIWSKGNVGDFHLKAKVKVTGENNSGIMYRAEPIGDTGFALRGNQLDIHPKPEYNGMLYSEQTGRGIIATRGQRAIVPSTLPAKGKLKANVTGKVGDESVYKINEWNEYEIIAVGNQLIHRVNGIVTVFVDDNHPDRKNEGLIGIQLHKGPALKVFAKDIMLRPLTDDKLIKEIEVTELTISEESVPTKPAAAKRTPKKRNPKKQDIPVGPAINENKATPAKRIKTLNDFNVEMLYTVPGDTQGSWINLCTDDKGRIIASDQFGGLYRFAPPAPGKPLNPASIEKMPVELIGVNGMHWINNALYVGINNYNDAELGGLYKITDSTGDDKLDKLTLLKKIYSRGDHGVHAVVPDPDGKHIFLITGNGAHMAEHDSSRVPEIWGEDHLLPRMPDGRGFMRTVMAPGGIIYRIRLKDNHWEIYSIGYRNIFDAAFNANGDLFTYDADMEYDFNTPWYRPTRVNHVVSGSDYGWRNGTGKRMDWYPDNLPPTLNIGPGSPTGTTFGYGAKFPPRYQNALYILDWSWGKLYAVHLKPDGASYSAEKEEFLSASPLALTDAIIHPADGAMYFAIGGRKVQSGLYRVTYTGKESTSPAITKPAKNISTDIRRNLEAFHGKQNDKAIDTAWPHLSHKDIFIRAAARTALESQPIEKWTARALNTKDFGKRVEALMGLSRAAGICPDHRNDGDPAPRKPLRDKILKSLLAIDFQTLTDYQQLTFVRTLQICLSRFGDPTAPLLKNITQYLNPLYPSTSRELDYLLTETLVHLQSDTVAAKAIELLNKAPTQEEQMEYARSLRMLKTGWTPELRTQYIEWMLKAHNYRGGASFKKFTEFIRDDALKSMSPEEKVELKDLLARQPEEKSPLEAAMSTMQGRQFQKAWTVDDFRNDAVIGMKGRNFETGKTMFAATACYTCHRFNNDGGMTGPDLTGAGGRYSPIDLLDQIINPSKEINEQFVPQVLTQTDGSTIIGTIVNLKGDSVTINTDPADPWQRINVDRKEVKSIEHSTVSTMPPGLLYMLTKDEVLDLIAYIISRGNPDDPAFKN